ncbi:hypothetical protein B0T16DRAFT_419773 [Cercophora newfieldiana]|uniref:Uncharacterized protein n=1 Tax=Cercophora newfieldiana TaxID=92897 RepID=A0AA39XW74_9PEZI|nr:hypothetical protein B0T16DRAFT_419773 [Cercophora newfieldiana]
MDSWRGRNYYTTDPSEWIELMNLSTADWMVAPFPPNLVAIDGALSELDVGLIANDSLVIEFAGKATVGSRFVERIIFGTVSAVVLGYMGLWLMWLWRSGAIIRPRRTVAEEDLSAPGDQQIPSAQGNNEDDSTANRGGESSNRSAMRFRSLLGKYYHEPIATQLEPCRKRSKFREADVVPTTKNLKEATELAFEAIEIEVKIRRLNDVGADVEKAAKLREKKTAALQRIQAMIEAWGTDEDHPQPKWKWWVKKKPVMTPTERRALNEIKALVARLVAGPLNTVDE